jgi:hypothetical protein
VPQVTRAERAHDVVRPLLLEIEPFSGFELAAGTDAHVAAPTFETIDCGIPTGSVTGALVSARNNQSDDSRALGPEEAVAFGLVRNGPNTGTSRCPAWADSIS